MESIYLFQIIGFAYIFTDPDPYVANYLYFLFTLCRIIHTIVYGMTFKVPQPVRGIAWIIGYFITGYMAVKTLQAFK